MPKKLTFEEFKNRLYIIDETIEPLYEFEKETGKTNKRKRRFIHCKCKIDGYEWDAEISRLLQGSGCFECNKLNLDEIKLKLKEINPNIEIISDKYINSNSKLKYKCKIDGCEWETSWSNVSRGTGCPDCGKITYNEKRSLNLDEIKDRLKQINPDIEIISGEYKNNKSKLVCICKIHNITFTIDWTHLQRGQGCPKCRILKLTGENSGRYKGGITPIHNYLRTHISQWKQDSFKKYNYKCDITGESDDLIIHHYYNFSDILQETMSILNLPIYQEVNKYTDKQLEQIKDKCIELHFKYGLGVCLTEKVHKEFHKIYGKENNTKEQYEEFKQNKIKKIYL